MKLLPFIKMWFCCGSASSIVSRFIRKPSAKPYHIAEILKTVEYSDTQAYRLQITVCKCIKVYDGDTITIATIFPNDIANTPYRFSVRLNGVDTPEIKTSNPDEKQRGIIARDALHEKIFGKIITLNVSPKNDKYGRILADVYLDGENICQWLIDEKHGVPYNGGTKSKW